jgi:hypothetical protein
MLAGLVQPYEIIEKLEACFGTEIEFQGLLLFRIETARETAGDSRPGLIELRRAWARRGHGVLDRANQAVEQRELIRADPFPPRGALAPFG